MTFKNVMKYMSITGCYTFLNETMLVLKTVHFILEDRFQTGHSFSFLALVSALLVKRKKIMKVHYN